MDQQKLEAKKQLIATFKSFIQTILNHHQMNHITLKQLNAHLSHLNIIELDLVNKALHYKVTREDAYEVIICLYIG